MRMYHSECKSMSEYSDGVEVVVVAVMIVVALVVVVVLVVMVVIITVVPMQFIFIVYFTCQLSVLPLPSSSRKTKSYCLSFLSLSWFFFYSPSHSARFSQNTLWQELTLCLGSYHYFLLVTCMWQGYWLTFLLSFPWFYSLLSTLSLEEEDWCSCDIVECGNAMVFSSPLIHSNGSFFYIGNTEYGTNIVPRKGSVTFFIWYYATLKCYGFLV